VARLTHGMVAAGHPAAKAGGGRLGACWGFFCRVARKQQPACGELTLGKILCHPVIIGHKPASACRNGDSAHLAGAGPQTGQKVNLVSAPTNH